MSDDDEVRPTVPNVCPRCANGRPICADEKPGGGRYAHHETCSTYKWAKGVCKACAEDLAVESAP